MVDEIIIRKVNLKDIERLVALYEDVWPNVTYKKRAKVEFVLKESKGINFVAEMNGEIIGSRTSFFMNFYFGSKKINCLHIGDSCTRGDCRGKGVFGKMNRALLTEFFINNKTTGQLIWNISVPASRRVYEKLGWQYIESLSTLLKICRPLHIISCVGLNISMISGPIDWDLDNEIISIDKALLDTREQIMREQNVLHVYYDTDTIIWRQKTFSGIKQFDDKNYGSVLYKVGNKNGLTILLIGEMFLKEYTNHNLYNLLSSLQKELSPDIIKLAISQGHPLLPLYRKNGFFYNFKHKFLDHGVRVETDEMKKICYQPTNWAISMLDVDTF